MVKHVKKKRPGRPKSSNPSTNTLGRVRVTDQQIKNYQKAAKDSGQTFSAWVRGVLDRTVSKSMAKK